MHHINSVKMPERLAPLLRIAWYPPEKSKTAVPILGVLSGVGRTTAIIPKNHEKIYP
jgi:hypothetical protein